jgi:hypothetical protein
LNNENTKAKGVAFITDERKELLSIKADPNANSQTSTTQNQPKPSSNLNSKKKTANPEEIIMGSMYIPKF